MKNFYCMILRFIFKIFNVKFSVKVKFPGEGVFISNNVSWLDPIILYAFLPQKTTFLLHHRLYKSWLLRLFMIGANIVEFDYLNADDIKKGVEALKISKYLVMFPENRMEDAGEILKVYDAPSIIAKEMKIPLIPIWIKGAEFSKIFSESKDLPHFWFPKICVNVYEYKFLDETKLNDNKFYFRDEIFNLLNQSRFYSKFNPKNTLFSELLSSAKLYGKLNRWIIDDITRKPQTYKGLLLKSYVLGGKFSKMTKNSENVGIILPNMFATIACFYGLSMYSRVPVMLNFSQGESVVLSACNTVLMKRLITSKTFIFKAKLTNLIETLKNNGIEIIYLEDILKQIGLSDKILGIWNYLIKKIPSKQKSSDNAVILFTSGTEGLPKAVVLSHSNILSNVYQTHSFETITMKDLMFSSLPIFHSFGLCIGVFYNLYAGGRVFLFPSPLQYKTISTLLYELRATIMVATDTFYKMYAKISHPYDFKYVRLCYAGAEAVKSETRHLTVEKLGIRLMEAYGATECSPVVCVNSFLFNKFGTLGKLPPAMEAKLEKVNGIENGGELCVKGPNILKGYIFANNPGVMVPVDEWYHTGDIVEIDNLGFIKIIDRVKRFAKIGGEMISLSAIENLAYEKWNSEDFRCCAVAISHDTKGEQIIFVSNNKGIDRKQFVELVLNGGLSELYIPSKFIYKEELPILATGKTDVTSLKKWVLENI